MKSKKIRQVARKLQAERKKDIKDRYKSVMQELDREVYERYAESKPIKDIYKDLAKCISAKAKIPDIDKHHVINDVLYPAGVSDWLADQVVDLLVTRVPTIDFLYKDLMFIKKDFEDISYKNGVLSAVTKDIILEDINFGPFRINRQDYIPCDTDDIDVCVEALRPNYPGGWDDEHTHPHVECGGLCTGNGTEAVGRALKDFRLLDYFHIINAILNTYGAGPFRGIEAWKGVPCADCGATCSNDEHYVCDCGEVSCYDCWMSCSKCEEGLCGMCMPYRCSDCENPMCEGCDINCQECGESICHECKFETPDGDCCKGCCEECSQCNISIPNSSIKECASCEEIICESCNENCPECDSNYHKKCEYVCCE